MSTTEPDEPRTAPTLSAVARLAGVSSITVSRVVRLPSLVAPETRSRVEAAMRDLGYVPNQVAGALASAEYRWTRRWSLLGHVDYSRIFGKAGDSPVVAQLGSKDQVTASFGLRYAFGR